MFPLLNNIEKLKDIGIKINFLENWKKDYFWDCDIVFLDSKILGLINPFDQLKEILDKRKNQGLKMVWLDNSASTGTTHFEILPFVDAYWKKQLLLDRSIYKKKLLGDRIYTDYYVKNNSAKIENNYNFFPLDSNLSDKISLSWNLGVGPYGLNNNISNLLRRLPWYLKRFLRYSYPNTSCLYSTFREREICFRGSNSYSNSAISLQRTITLQKLKKYSINTKSIKHNLFLKELQNSKIAISPYGYGEICYRDFEIFFNGSALLKPSMDHLETFPQWYIKNKTYIPLDWDFENFDDLILFFKDNEEKRLEIANEGQRNFLNFHSNDSQEFFCKRLFKKILQI